MGHIGWAIYFMAFAVGCTYGAVIGGLRTQDRTAHNGARVFVLMAYICLCMSVAALNQFMEQMQWHIFK